MKRNEGSVDRIFRLVAGLFLAVSAFFVGGVALKIALGVLAGTAVLTASTGFCPLYVPLGIDTGRAAKPK
jgi:hypothetical protein